MSSAVPVFGRSNTELQRGRSRARKAFEFLQKEEGKVNKQDPLWIASSLRDVKWDDIDLKSFREDGAGMRVAYIIGLLFAASYFYDYLSDVLMCYTLIKEYWYSTRAMPVIYFITIAISILIFYYDYQLALRIKNTGDVSDTFMNEEALRFASVEYDKFCLIKKVLDRLNITDRLAKRIQAAVHTWKRLLLVNVPQFVITAIALGLYKQASLTELTSDEHTKIERVKLASYLIKIILLSFDGLFLLIGTIGYPCFRCYISSQVEDYKHVVTPSMRKFVTWRIDFRLNQLLGLVRDPQHPDRVPVVMVIDANGQKRRLKPDELASHHQRAKEVPIAVEFGAAKSAPPPTERGPHHHPQQQHDVHHLPTAASSPTSAGPSPTSATPTPAPAAAAPLLPVAVDTPSTLVPQQPHYAPAPIAPAGAGITVSTAPIYSAPPPQPLFYPTTSGSVAYNYPPQAATGAPAAIYVAPQPPPPQQVMCGGCSMMLAVPPGWPPNSPLTCPRCQTIFIVR